MRHLSPTMKSDVNRRPSEISVSVDASETPELARSFAAEVNKANTNLTHPFGASVDASTLNLMAVQAGTELPACDVANEVPDAADNCYQQADNLSELASALESVAYSVSKK